jgi:hypothetical protein
VAGDGSVGKAWNYGSRSAADQSALNSCPRAGCDVLVDFVNGCGAIAFNPNTNEYWGGQGATPADAESAAIAHAGGGRWITWVCTKQ